MSGMMSRPGAAARPSPWVVLPKPNPTARLRLFCFPYAGGGASIYAAWGRLLPPDTEVVAVQLPGRESRIGEPPIAEMSRLVPAMADALVPFMDRPFAFFGHSIGGLMAFELARHLRCQGRTLPASVIVSGRPAPQVTLEAPTTWDLPEAEFHDMLRRFNGTPEEVLQHQEIMQLITPMLRADFALGETYAYTAEAPLPMPLSAYGGVGDAEVPTWTVEAWRDQAAGEYRTVMFSGGHFFINENRDEVLRELSRELGRAGRDG